MNLKLKVGQLIDYIIDSLTYINIKLVSFLPNGRLVILDLKRAGITLETIFDVGANIGQTATSFNKHFPAAKIFCFEPVAATFNEMVNNTLSSQITCIKKALGGAKGESKIYKSDSYNGISSINGKGNSSFSQVETIIVDTGINVCKEYNITDIDMLKIDTEGYEMEVLKGFEPMLKKHIKLIYIEVGFDPTDPCKTYISDLLIFLRAYNFIPSSMYDSYRLGRGKLKLNHSDLLLINTNLIEV
ncbi:MAG: FkbM family methyltransferase [Bacteroidota bacterium]